MAQTRGARSTGKAVQPKRRTVRTGVSEDVPASPPRRRYSGDTLLGLYRALVKPRLIEERMLLLLRQGKVSKWFSGIGQEAISVGCTMALENDEFVLTLHRNLGVFTSREVPFHRLFSQWQGGPGGFTKGRDRSFHFGAPDFHIVGMISHLGPQLCVADGIALAHRLKRERKVTLVFTGEGGTSEGDFHEALNVAAVWDLPVIFVIENNGYALSTPPSEQFRCARLSDRALGYGIEGVTIDGNNLLEVYETIGAFAEALRSKPRPVLVECMTFRMRGHEEASGVKYVPKELFEEWGKRDPVIQFEDFLLGEGGIEPAELTAVREIVAAEIEEGLERVFDEAPLEASIERELADVHAPSPAVDTTPPAGPVSKKRFIDALSDGLRQGMEQHPGLILMGQDIAEYGGVFKVTEGFVERFGRDRVRNTPLCESAILGASLGLAIKGMKSVVEMQFADFVSSGFNQIVNNLAKTHYRWGQTADVVVRMPTGAGSGAGPFHSQSNEAWFAHTPGLKVVYPSNPYDAKGLLLSSIDDPNPVMFFEHKVLYRSVGAEIPDAPYRVPIGKANLVREGERVSVITYGMGVHWALETLAKHPHVDASVLDLRTLLPLDVDAIAEVAKRTGRVLILHEDTLFGGIGGEIAAYIAEHCFEYLDAPVRRVASLDTPVPFASALEAHFLPKARFEQALLELADY